MTKTELQQQLDARGIEYDKRWGAGKLQGILDGVSGIKPQPEDQVGLKPAETEEDGDSSGAAEVESTEGETEAEEEAPKAEEKPVNAIVQGLRDNAKIVSAGGGFKSLAGQTLKNRAYKLGRRTYVKVVKESSKAVEIYEKESSKFIRAYTEKVHGKEYKKLADKFIDTRKNVMDAPVKIKYGQSLIARS
jgi:hypothetical protein